MSVIATVSRVQGEVLVVDPAGVQRRLREGDLIQDGDTIVTNTGTVDLAFITGSTLSVPEQQIFVADASVGGEGNSDDSSTGGPLPPVVNNDLNSLLEQEATAAGFTGGGGNEGGSTFVQLDSLNEGPPLGNTYTFGSNGFQSFGGNPPNTIPDPNSPNGAPGGPPDINASADTNWFNPYARDDGTGGGEGSTERIRDEFGIIRGEVIGGADHGTGPNGGSFADIADTARDGSTLTVTHVSSDRGTEGNAGDPVVGSYGVLTVGSSGGYSYQFVDFKSEEGPQPNALPTELDDGEAAPDRFTYTVQDGSGHTTQATLTVYGFGQNDAPTANNDDNFVNAAPTRSGGGDVATTTGNVVLGGPAHGPWSDSRDTDPDNPVGFTPGQGWIVNSTRDKITVTGVSHGGSGGTDTADGFSIVGNRGTLEISRTGEYTYHYKGGGGGEPGSGGTDVFNYQISDGTVAGTPGQLTIHINNAPIANNDSNQISLRLEQTQATGDFTPAANTPHGGGTADNKDTDPNNGLTVTDTLTVTGIRAGGEGAATGTTTSANGTYGTLVLDNASGNYTYTLFQNNVYPQVSGQINVQDVFTYTVTDGMLSDQGTLTISINNFRNDA